jgi:uncharacterized protein YndB with AHSA1/START domain
MGARHGTFTLIRELAASPDLVFAAFGDPEKRKRWFRIPGTPDATGHQLDFRVGGHERNGATFAVSGTPEHIEYRSHFLDIQTDERIVSASSLIIDGILRSTSLVTVELAPRDGETRLTYTEQYALLAYDGAGDAAAAEREGGTKLLLNGLTAALRNQPPTDAPPGA